MNRRCSQSGVTMIEVLAALSVSAMIGIAGFTLLDGVVSQDARLKGRIDKIMVLDRAFQLLVLDTSSARSFGLTDQGSLRLVEQSYVVIWRADDNGLRRELVWPDDERIVQVVLEEATQFALHSNTDQGLVVELPNDDLVRLISLPAPVTK